MMAKPSAAATVERPIIFQAESIRAILDGRKTQTRRVIKPQPIESESGKRLQWGYKLGAPKATSPRFVGFPKESPDAIAEYCPYGKPIERLWIREAWHISDLGLSVKDRWGVCYAADEQKPENWKWRSPIFMPRWASRLTLEITEVRVERLQDISEEDAKAEGAQPDFNPDGFEPFPEATENDRKWMGSDDLVKISMNRRHGFRIGWDRINAKRGYGWDANPFCWVISFRRIN